MECNKDDAIKAREIAERKFKAKDIAGAKKFALKAQKLDPGLEGIAQLLVTLDVYTASENQIVGETDWYDVLGVSPQADDDAVRKQYRKLALILHPDKNKSVGAEGAFKFVSQAWSLLSDKSRRAAYDAKRDAVAKPPSGANGMYNFPKTTMSNAKLNKNKNVHRTNGPSNGGSTSKSNPDTFWTICLSCRMQYEYLRTYVNQNLLCPRCRQPFFAVEQPPPDSKSSSRPSKKSHQDSRTKSNPKGDFQWVPFSGAAGVSSAAQAANVVQQTYDKVRRVREEAQASKNRDKVMKRKNYGSENIVGSSVEKKQRVGDYIGMSNSVVPSPKLHNILMHKAQKEIRKQINGYKPATCEMVKMSATCEMVKKTEKVHDQDKNTGTTVTKSDLHDVGLTKVKVLVPVPDSDFRGFDQYRTGKDFEEGQVWAVYDDVDGMPRHYAMIHRIVLRDLFRVKVSWLNSNSNSNVGCGFRKTVGDFRVGRRETYDGLDCFSHKVRWTKDSFGAICIFPRKGDVWAVYRNWSKDWDELTADDVIQKYDIVEVLDDYDEDLGVVVIPLVKVAGFKALFHRHLDPEQVREIPKKEISRFSHQVPSHLLSGKEGPNAPKGCWELDLATLPVEFHKVIDNVGEDIEVNKAINQGEPLFHDDIPKPIKTIAEEEKTKELHRIWNDH